ncbi:GNAT family N-acetyltransferase [Marilutibacter aestuarii]|uniref:GNAT family N-acetyltransferase n=1 Tax=Marilutibacter aestuarii TaxID=1706195 RepID=A0A508A5P4_9GAMM|nr:GNAT family N-acetyltransferase [Lysobacter aestuarii]TQD45266.1 GNAT family N-acetyltransferase [Lysobacter aestuarii]
MSDPAPAFRVEAVDYASALPELRHVRETVFVQEQGVPLDLELDAMDPQCDHVLARDAEGRPIGTGRLTPERRIGRMAVLPGHRGQGVGEAMLEALLARALAHRWPSVSLHAQADAIAFYTRHGFLPRGPRFEEAGIVHQDMHRSLGVPTPVEGFEAARAALVGLVARARRELCLHTRELDPGLLDRPEIIEAIRRLVQDGGELRVLLRDPKAAQDALSPLISLGQRRSSAIAFRVIEEPVDLNFAGAYAFNDRGGWYYRPLGHRVDGETRIDDPARVRQLRAAFQEIWERARPCSEFRALGL